MTNILVKQTSLNVGMLVCLSKMYECWSNISIVNLHPKRQNKILKRTKKELKVLGKKEISQGNFNVILSRKVSWCGENLQKKQRGIQSR